MANRLSRTRLVLVVAALIAIGSVSSVHATVLNYIAFLDGPSESPPNVSPGIGTAQVDIDDVLNTMRVRASFTGLLGTVTACHIHGPTAVAGTGTAGVMTTTPTFTGFQSGVTAGVYDHTFDLTLASSYNPAFVTANGGSVPAAEAAFLAAIAAGKAYFNIHSTAVSAGEIRGFLAPFEPTPTAQQSWGRIKNLYR